MKIYSVYDPEFKAYGQVVSGMDDTIEIWAREKVEVPFIAPEEFGTKLEELMETNQENKTCGSDVWNLFNGCLMDWISKGFTNEKIIFINSCINFSFCILSTRPYFL